MIAASCFGLLGPDYLGKEGSIYLVISSRMKPLKTEWKRETIHQEKFFFGPHFKLFLMVGFLGAFTTFSAFGFETWELAQEDQWLKATLNIFLSFTLSMLGLLAGIFLGRLF